MIKFKNVSFQYEGQSKKNILLDINLNIKKGEVVVFSGESGCGKTTLTRIMNGLIPNYYRGKLLGEVHINNKDILKMSIYDISKFVGSVFQNPRSQFYCMDTNSELAFGSENHGVDKNEIEKRIQLTSNNLDLKDLLNRDMFNLSGGEKQKIACGSVNVLSPDIVVLDEPSSNLDDISTKKLAEIICIWKKMGKTVVIAEHRVYYLSKIADRIIFMSEGQIINELSIEEARELNQNQLETMGLRSLSLESLKLNIDYSKQINDRYELKDFSHSYVKGKMAIAIPKLYLPKNEIIGIIGHNGAGKSRFIKKIIYGYARR